MNILHNGGTVTVDGQFCPRSHSSYTTRLFLSKPFPNRGQNWTVHQIMGRAWHAMSFNNVPASLPWTNPRKSPGAAQMRVSLKIAGPLLDQLRSDLSRPHFFANERVGFLTAGAAIAPDGLLLLVRGYMPVADEDYEVAPNVGARIGSNAMRKAAQAAYRPASTLLHVHTHGGRGLPRFSGVDIESGNTFVPGFFQSCPKTPHGLLVLSNDSATGLLWLEPGKRSVPINRFVRVDQPVVEQWSAKNDGAAGGRPQVVWSNGVPRLR